MRINCTLQLRDDNNEEIEVTAEADFELDTNYGADADGNRGRRVWELTSLEIKLPQNKDETLTIEEKSRLYAQAEEKIWDKLFKETT